MGDTRKAAASLNTGGVIAYPTEAVFGLGCDPKNTPALKRLLALKKRPLDKGLILIAASIEQIQAYIQPLSPQELSQVSSSWPGPVTWVVPVKEGISDLVTGKRDTIAVRVTNHPVAAQICHDFGGAITSTSANRSGQPPARTVAGVQEQFGNQLDYIVEGQTGGRGEPTTIWDIKTGVLLRP
ncbi:MAG: threonylcarbamoyl-AMP synthase [Gammaproteobacteria bacterium]|nr:threonylcarbamoyl-AMP synthase [Gammaproteobacteria bacterium]